MEQQPIEKKRSRGGGFLNLFDWSSKSKKKLLFTKEPNGDKQNLLLDDITKRTDSSCSTSTVTSDDIQQVTSTRAPSVVARLMGLNSLPISSSNPIQPTRVNSNLDLDPFFLRSSRWDDDDDDDDDVIDYKLPINRFQTETLPPKSAKPISVTHNRLLSPIRSPRFVQTKNVAYVMETASRMIEQSPRLATKARFSSSSSSSSLPMRIRDLREKLEASSLKGPIFNSTHNLKGKNDDKRSTTSPGRSSFDGSKAKVKPSSKVNHKQNSSVPSSSNRIQKEKTETKNRAIRNGLYGKTVVKSSVSSQKGSKVIVNKVTVVESGTKPKRNGFTSTSTVKDNTLSLSRNKNLTRNKKPVNGVQESRIISQKPIKRVLKTYEDDDRKKDIDVVSFTFSSPIKGLSTGSQTSMKRTGQEDTKSALCFNKIDSDSLNTLLEQKIRELTSKIESSSSSLLTQEEEEESSSSISKEWVNGTISLPSDDLDQDDSISECTSFFNNRKLEGEGDDWELEYIREIIASDQLLTKEVSLGMATDVLPLSLFEEIEGERDERGKIERKMLFDFVNEFLTLKCKDMLFMGREVFLAEEVKSEVERLKKMRGLMMDELVDNDMSVSEGKWLDYKREVFEEGGVIGEEIVEDLVDDLVNDLLHLCF